MNKIKCPNCCSIKTVSYPNPMPDGSVWNEYWCMDCDCKFNPDKQKPENERAWEWFCDLRLLKTDYIEKVYIDRGRATARYGVCSTELLGYYHTKDLGWQRMPPRTRGERNVDADKTIEDHIVDVNKKVGE